LVQLFFLGTNLSPLSETFLSIQYYVICVFILSEFKFSIFTLSAPKQGEKRSGSSLDKTSSGERSGLHRSVQERSARQQPGGSSLDKTSSGERSGLHRSLLERSARQQPGGPHDITNLYTANKSFNSTPGNSPAFNVTSLTSIPVHIKPGLWIRIRIGNPDPGARKFRNFSGKMHFLVTFQTNLLIKRCKIALTTF
jgi:hypothetical protein